MNRAKRRAARRLPDQRKEKPVVRKMSRAEKGTVAFVLLVAGCALLFNVAAGLCPMITEKCLRCWWTKNSHCNYLQQKSLLRRHKGNVNTSPNTGHTTAPTIIR